MPRVYCLSRSITTSVSGSASVMSQISFWKRSRTTAGPCSLRLVR